MFFKRLHAPFANLSLGVKGVLAVAIPVVALVVAMAVFRQFEGQSRIAGERIRHTLEVRAEFRRIGDLLAEAGNGVRGYLLTRRVEFLAPYTAARQNISEPLNRMHILVKDEPVLLQRLSRLEAQSAEALLLLDQMRAHTEAGRLTEAIALLDRNQAVLDAAESELAAIDGEELRLFVEWNTRARIAGRRLRIAMLVGGLAGLLGGLAAIFILMQGVRRRIRRIQQDAHRVAEGLPIETLAEGGDEIDLLERDLKETSNLLAGQARELRAAHAELESRVKQRTADLSTAVESLRQANEVLEAVVRSAPLAIFALDLDGNVTFWNPGAERIFGYAEAEVKGRPLPVIPPGQEEEHNEWIEKLRTGWSVAGVERKRRRKDGALIDVAIWTAPLRDSEGRLRGTVVVDSDVSQHRLLEEQFRQSQKLEAVGRLAGGVAHDFNNLLTVISGYAEMMLGEAQLSPRVVEYAREIQQAAGRATSLTGQLLTFSRRQRIQPRALNLNDVVTNSLRLLRRVIGEDLQVSTHLAPDLGRVNADPIHIDQVIMNLVVNARDAMPDGGTLTVETASTWLDQDYADRHLGVTPGPYVMLAISDTGIGMTPEIRSRLFEPFFTTKEAGKGTGLGLSIVYGIVKQSNGEIVVYSEPGQGTTFKVYLPAIDAPQEMSATEAGPTAERGAGTVLVCEDEEIIRRLVETMLSRQGYRIIESDSPIRALELLRESGQPIDLLLTDVVLPKMTGFDLAREARALRPGIKVIYMSGYTDNRIRGGLEGSDQAPLLEKPFTAAVLSRLVRQVLSGKMASG